MGLRCLVGHDFGAVETDREREQRGDEVVITVREYRECARCGETRVLSENKEVRTTATEDDEDEPDAEDSAPDAPGLGADVESVSAEDDDGVILVDEGEEPAGRGRGEWPDSDDTGAPAGAEAEPAPWPDVEGEDEGYAAEPGGGAAEGVEFDGSLTPERSPADADAAGDAGSEGEIVEAASEPSGAGGSRSRSAGRSSGRQRVVSAGADVELFCPECQHTAPAGGSSLRPGDICPECHKGYLTEREQ